MCSLTLRPESTPNQPQYDPPEFVPAFAFSAAAPRIPGPGMSKDSLGFSYGDLDLPSGLAISVSWWGNENRMGN